MDKPSFYDERRKFLLEMISQAEALLIALKEQLDELDDHETADALEGP